jgi:hypothetical protein
MTPLQDPKEPCIFLKLETSSFLKHAGIFKSLPLYPYSNPHNSLPSTVFCSCMHGTITNSLKSLFVFEIGYDGGGGGGYDNRGGGGGYGGGGQGGGYGGDRY